jgi:hypothetical protein
VELLGEKENGFNKLTYSGDCFWAFVLRGSDFTADARAL